MLNFKEVFFSYIFFINIHGMCHERQGLLQSYTISEFFYVYFNFYVFYLHYKSEGSYYRLVAVTCGKLSQKVKVVVLCPLATARVILG